MAIYDTNGTTSAEIGKLYDNDNTTSYQIGKVYDHDGTVSRLVYTGSEVKSGTISYIRGGDDSYGGWGSVSFNIPVGDTFRVDSVWWNQGIYTNDHLQIIVNGQTVVDWNQTVGGYTDRNFGPYPTSGYYTSTQGTNTLIIRMRGWGSTASGWGGTTATRNYQVTLNP